MLPGFARQSVVRVRPGVLAAGGHNNASKPDWVNTTDVTIAGCSVQPGSTLEDLKNADTVLVQWTVWLPGYPDILATDGIRYDGVLYSVNGQPKRWPSATGALNHTELELKAWEG